MYRGNGGNGKHGENGENGGDSRGGEERRRTIGVRTPYAIEQIAPAVYRPTPGTCFSSISGSEGRRSGVSLP